MSDPNPSVPPEPVDPADQTLESPGAPEDFADLGKILAIIPTYNESGNIERITARVRAAVPSAHILVADDNSPDGTGKIADSLADEDDHIHVLHRLGKEGLGAAYLAGFTWGIENGFDVLIEMDADGSHAPEQLPLLLDALRNADLVLGSRWVPGGSVSNWPKTALAARVTSSRSILPTASFRLECESLRFQSRSRNAKSERQK